MKRKQLINIVLILSIIFSFIELLDPKKSNSEAINDNQIEFQNIYQNYPNKISGIAKVTDGDSIKINKEPIRLLEIDAPEIKQKCFDKDNIQYQCGQNSYNFLFNLVDGKNINCFYKEKDIYNRYLGYCFDDNILINKEILKSGNAVIYNYSASSKSFIEAEEQAKNQNIGIWQGKFILPKNYRKMKK